MKKICLQVLLKEEFLLTCNNPNVPEWKYPISHTCILSNVLFYFPKYLSKSSYNYLRIFLNILLHKNILRIKEMFLHLPLFCSETESVSLCWLPLCTLRQSTKVYDKKEIVAIMVHCLGGLIWTCLCSVTADCSTTDM